MNKHLKKLAFGILICIATYGIGRLYFELTDGFSVRHISSDFAYDKRWETHALSQTQFEEIQNILSQKFTYLGKGCQSYVFLSDDGTYVIKFFKYQRLRPRDFEFWFSFIPAVKKNLDQKIEKKRLKREGFFSSWVVAFDHLSEQTGLVYVHLNKSSNLEKKVTIIDKIGMSHELNMDDMEFLIQKKATMLCSTIDSLMADGKIEETKNLLTRLIQMIVLEYKEGIADHDFAIMQNSGVYEGRPVHIDVGQFEKQEVFKTTGYYYQELFNKTWKFRIWLRKAHPELLTHLESELHKVLGESFYTLKYIPKEH